MQPDFDDTVTAPPSLSPAGAHDGGIDAADTIVKAPVLEPPAIDAAPARYGSHDAWPATDGGLPGRASYVIPELPAAPAAPRYYGFRLGGSATILLDAIAYVGRRPSAPRVVRGGIPRLVRVGSEAGEVSSTHVELRQEGRTVVVTDMRSTNGTTIGVPGLPVRRLRQGESVVVTPGTLIDIGDGNVIEIVPLQELA